MSWLSFRSMYVQRLRAVTTVRYIHSTPVTHKLIGPPDPVSNLRPVIYDEDEPATLAQAVKMRENSEQGKKKGKETVYMLPAQQTPKTSPTHPYLLDEFDGDPVEYQWRMERKRMDAFNHTFWTNSNTRFEVAKQEILSALPETASSHDREVALSHFYAQWVGQEGDHLKQYAEEWNRRNWNLVFMEMRTVIRRWKTRLFDGPSQSKQYTSSPSSSKLRKGSS